MADPKNIDQIIDVEPSDASPDVQESGLLVKDDQIPTLGIITPQITPQQARDAWQAYQELCEAILTPSDVMKLNGKPFKKKSAWRKLSTAFNLSTEITKEERSDYEGYFVVRITARTTAPNGRFMDGTGSCASNERDFAHKEHDVRAQAETRAKNRSISDMIGGGEVSAEEMMEINKPQKAKCKEDHGALGVMTAIEGKHKGRKYTKCPSCLAFTWLDEEKK